MNDNDEILKFASVISLEDLGYQSGFKTINNHKYWIKDYEEYVRFFSELYSKMKLEDYFFSKKGLEQIVALDFFDLKANPDAKHDIIEEVLMKPKVDVHVLQPVFNIVLDVDTLKIGEFSLIKYQFIQDYCLEIGLLMPNDIQNEFQKDDYFDSVPFVDIIESARDNEFALEKAAKKMSVFIHFLNYSILCENPELESIRSYSNVGKRNRYIAVSKNGFTSYVSECISNKQCPSIDFFIDQLMSKKTGNDKLIKIIQKEKISNELEKRIYNAINWIGLSIEEKDNSIALTKATFAIESLLQSDVSGEPISKSTVASISEMIAFLLGNDYSSRNTWEGRFKKIYSERSKIVHGKSEEVQRNSVLDAINMARKTVIALLTIPELDKAKSIKEINQYIKNKRYS